MADIDFVMHDICESGAEAIHRYVEVSGIDPSDMPEYFMPAFILDRMGSKVTVTLETGFSKLSEWNQNIRQGRGLPPREQEEQAKLLALAEELGSPRVDMVLYQGDVEGHPKDQQGFLALVEFKRGYLSTADRDRLLRIIPHIDTCPYGVVCGCITGDHTVAVADARKVGDRWFEVPVKPSPGDDHQYFFCARLFSRTAPSSLANPVEVAI